MRDWTGHVRDDAARREEIGADRDAAREAAWAALGAPAILARSAASELAKTSWLGRHPWIAGLLLPVLAWLALLAATFFLPGLVGSLFWNEQAMEGAHPSRLIAVFKCWEFVFNWLPWIVSLVWVRCLAVRMPGGWKLFWITAIVLALFSTSVWMKIQPPLHGPNSGSAMIYASGILGAIANAVGHVMGYGWQFRAWSDWARYTGLSWMQAAIMLLGLLAFHFKATARSGDTGTVQLG